MNSISDVVKPLEEYVQKQVDFYSSMGLKTDIEFGKEVAYKDILEKLKNLSGMVKFRRSDMAKVYVVIEEGYHEDYGSYPYLIGVFDNKEDAEKIKDNAIDPEGYTREIIEIEKNKEFPLNPGYFEDEYENDYPLGGYAE